MLAFTSGLFMGGSLIIAIGAQNSFLIEQSLKRQGGILLACLFTLSDAISISLGALGFGLLVQQFPLLMTLSKWAGVIFLLWFAINKWRASLASDSVLLQASQVKMSLAKVFATALAVTWLNPHFYLDTLILMGNLASQWEVQKWQFVAGAISASALWFGGLTLLTSACAKWLAKPNFWRWFNRINALILGGISLQIAAL